MLRLYEPHTSALVARELKVILNEQVGGRIAGPRGADECVRRYVFGGMADS